MEIIRYEPKYLNEWEDFITHSNNGTIFHTRKFLSYHTPDKFEDHSLLFKNKGKLISALTGAVIEKGGKKVFSSHQGASFGGFVYKDTLGIKETFQLTEEFIDYCSVNGFKRIQLTHSPFIYQKRYNNYPDFALIKNGFQYLKREITSVICLDVPGDETFSLFKPEARTSTRRAMKTGVEIRKSDDYKTYYKILKSNLNLRHNVQPAHTLDELIKLKNLFPDKIELIGAFLGTTMIAGVVNFYCSDKVVLVFYISHNPEYQQYRPVNLLFYTIIKEAITKRYKYLDFGLFSVNMDPNWGLGKFKESFGARGIFRDYFYLDL